MSDSSIQVPPDSTGKKVRTKQYTVAAVAVEQEIVTLAHQTTTFHRVALATNNAASIKASPGQVYGIHAFNNALYPIYVKLYDKASAPNPAADTPFKTIAVQAGLSRDISIAGGVSLLTGIAIAIVKGIGDTDNTPVLAADGVVDVIYE